MHEGVVGGGGGKESVCVCMCEGEEGGRVCVRV